MVYVAIILWRLILVETDLLTYRTSRTDAWFINAATKTEFAVPMMILDSLIISQLRRILLVVTATFIGSDIGLASQSCLAIQSAGGRTVNFHNECDERILVNWKFGGTKKLGVERAIVDPNGTATFQMAGPSEYAACKVDKRVAVPQICTPQKWRRVPTLHDFSGSEDCLTDIEEADGDFVYFVGIKNICPFSVNAIAIAIPEAKPQSGGYTSEGRQYLVGFHKFIARQHIPPSLSMYFPKEWKSSGGEIVYGACAAHHRQETYPLVSDINSYAVNASTTCTVFDEVFWYNN